MALGLFRLIGALGRTMVIANTFGSFALLVAFVLGGFILARGTISAVSTFAREEVNFSRLGHEYELRKTCSQIYTSYSRKKVVVL